MVKNVRETTDNGIGITNDEDDIAVYQTDGMFSDPDHRPDDVEDRLGRDPDHPNEPDEEETEADNGGEESDGS